MRNSVRRSASFAFISPSYRHLTVFLLRIVSVFGSQIRAAPLTHLSVLRIFMKADRAENRFKILKLNYSLFFSFFK